MDEQQLAEIEERVSRATPGPWRSGHGGVLFARKCRPNDNAHGHYAAPYGISVEGTFKPAGGYLPDRDEANATADFIAAARQDVPALLVEVARQRDTLDHLASDLEAERAGTAGMVAYTRQLEGLLRRIADAWNSDGGEAGDNLVEIGDVVDEWERMDPERQGEERQ
jgi:hypothetical protein